MENKEELVKRFQVLQQEINERRDEQLKISGKVELLESQEKEEKKEEAPK